MLEPFDMVEVGKQGETFGKFLDEDADWPAAAYSDSCSVTFSATDLSFSASSYILSMTLLYFSSTIRRLNFQRWRQFAAVDRHFVF